MLLSQQHPFSSDTLSLSIIGFSSALSIILTLSCKLDHIFKELRILKAVKMEFLQWNLTGFQQLWHLQIVAGFCP